MLFKYFLLYTHRFCKNSKFEWSLKTFIFLFTILVTKDFWYVSRDTLTLFLEHLVTGTGGVVDRVSWEKTNDRSKVCAHCFKESMNKEVQEGSDRRPTGSRTGGHRSLMSCLLGTNPFRRDEEQGRQAEVVPSVARGCEKEWHIKRKIVRDVHNILWMNISITKLQTKASLYIRDPLP